MPHLEAKRPEWQARNIISDQSNSWTAIVRNMRDCIDQYGFNHWTDFFSPRQLLGHCTSVEVFHELVDEIREEQRRKRISDLDQSGP